jgi:ParB/RepB/Spo0J family partition protein
MQASRIDIGLDKVVLKQHPRAETGDLAALESSIAKLGVLHPIIVDRHNVLIAGSRRLVAARQAGLSSIPAVKLEAEYTDMLALDIQADENLCRLPLAPEELEEQIQRKKRTVEGARHRKVLGSIKRALGRGSRGDS